MAGKLQGKVALVTGAGRGIGRGIASLMATEGARVLIADNGSFVDGRGLNAQVAEDAAREVVARGDEAAAYCGDVSATAQADAMVAAAIDRWGQLDILVNAAGNYRLTTIADLVDEDWDDVIRVHLRGTMATTRAAARHWVGRGRPGRIINFTSLAGTAGLPVMVSYSTAKAGIIGFTRACANALVKYSVTANCISPLAHTRMVDRSRPPEDVEQFRRTGVWPATSATLARGGAAVNEPASVAPLVVYLASDAASNISGRIFGAGGRHYSLWSEYEEVRHLWSEGAWNLDRLFAEFPETLGQGLSLADLPWPLETLDLPRERDFPHEILG